MSMILCGLRKFAASISLLLIFFAWPANSLEIYTEEFPPYNFTDNNQLRGISVELLLAAARQTNSSIRAQDIRVQPWPRAYRKVLSTPNTMLFSMAYIPSREKLFKWVGPIGQTRVVLLAKKDRNIRINDPSQLIDYKIGTIRDDVAQKLVEENGVPVELIEHTSTTRALAQMLDLGRIDLWAYEENAARWVMEKAGLDSREFESVYTLMELDMYFALNKDTDQQLIDELQLAIDGVMEQKSSNGRSFYQEVYSHYLPE